MYITPISIKSYSICLLCELNTKDFDFCKNTNNKNRYLVCKFFVPMGTEDHEMITLQNLNEAISFGDYEDEDDSEVKPTTKQLSCDCEDIE